MMNALRHHPIPHHPEGWTEDQIDGYVRWMVATTQDALRATVPLSKPSPYSRRWWTRELTALRKAMNRTQRSWQKRGKVEDWTAWRTARKQYR
ncbi:uncharacterized protein SCHCODRAFT_01121060, partial [Schizophyllum commune H4-8]|uniref:uncharacterized protein n=1 Tax=Schizophyllum commune (strain H4-8 / FGSC 9210) TaxID=578458 RepID=UPI00215FDB80